MPRKRMTTMIPNLISLGYAITAFEGEDRLDVFKTWKYLAIIGLLNAYIYFAICDNT